MFIRMNFKYEVALMNLHYIKSLIQWRVNFTHTILWDKKKSQRKLNDSNFVEWWNFYGAGGNGIPLHHILPRSIVYLHDFLAFNSFDWLAYKVLGVVLLLISRKYPLSFVIYSTTPHLPVLSSLAEAQQKQAWGGNAWYPVGTWLKLEC